MTARITEGDWTPLEGALPLVVDADKVYLIPTRVAMQNDEGAEPELCYTDAVRYLPKAARADGLPLEFSQSADKRRYLQEFSADPEMWSLGLSVVSLVNDWLILTVSLFIAHRADRQGWTSEQAQALPLKVLVAETETGRNFEVEGTGSEVVEALRVLQGEAVTGKRKKKGKKDKRDKRDKKDKKDG